MMIKSKLYFLLIVLLAFAGKANSQCLVMASNVAPATCNQNNGLVELTFTGGLPPYSVNFNGIPTGTLTSSLQISGLAPGVYSFSVMDNNNFICTGDVSVIVSAAFNNPPQVTLSPVPPSCDTCWDGTIIALATGTAPFTYIWNTGATTPTIANLSCGSYQLIVTDANGCSSIDTAILNCPGSGIYFLRGKTFYDTNSDGQFNSGDYSLSNQMVELIPTNQIVYSNWNGDYSFTVDSGNYSVAFLPQQGNPFQQVNGSDTLNVSVNNASVLNLDFSLFPDSLITDYLAMSNFWLPRCNSIQTLLTAVTNYGTTTDSIHVNVIFPPSISFFNSSSFSVLNGDTLSYYLSGVMPGQTVYLNSNFLLPGGGTQFPIKSYVTSVDQNGNQTSYDTTTVNTQIICGCDPNDKQVSPQIAFITMDSTLNYLIRFQNTGTDTTFKVVVIDTLDANLNPASFKLFATSHPCQVFRENNILRFVFDNILLPDSNTNEAASHGYIFFSIDVFDNTNTMTIPNKAHIFFDANADVETPYATTAFVVCVGITEMQNQDLKVFPNPASDVVNLSFDWNLNHHYSYSLIDAIGHILISNQNLISNKINLPEDLSKGIYLLEVSDKTTHKKFTTKIQIK